MWKKILTFSITLFIIIGVCTIAVCIHRKKDFTNFNEDSVIGNTSGNLNNNGLICEKNNMIYFANPSDSMHLYAMKPDGSDLRLISKDVVSYINVDSNYIYYARNNVNKNNKGGAYSFLHVNTNSLVRCDLDGDNIVILDDSPCLYPILVGNYIYYIHYDKKNASTLYRVKIDGSEKKQLKKNPYLPCATDGSYIFYNGLEDNHNLYKLDTKTLSSDCIATGNYWMPQIIGDTAYVMDCINNYALLRLNLSDNTSKTICDQRIDCFNVADDVIYFQRNDKEKPALCKINTDGTGLTELMTGNFTSINITDQYVYFQPFNRTDDTLYRIERSSGSNVNPENFLPGKGNNK